MNTSRRGIAEQSDAREAGLRADSDGRSRVPPAATDRLELLDGLPLIDINADVISLARRLIEAHTMPEKAAADSIHVAAAALGGAKYLLTLNCRHIANAHELPRIYDLLGQEGLGQLLICTPAEFLGAQDDDERSDT